MEFVLKIVTVVLWSAFKFVVGMGIGMGFGFNPVLLFACTVGGGMLGVVFYLYLWSLIVKIWHRFFPRKPKPVKFSKLKRKLVRFIKRYEEWGIVLLTPVLLSMPVGTILANSIEHNKWRIKVLMFVSLVFWAMVIMTLKHLLNINIEQWFG